MERDPYIKNIGLLFKKHWMNLSIVLFGEHYVLVICGEEYTADNL